MASSLTIGRIIDIARARHPLFASMAADGVIVSAIDAKQRTIVLQLGGAIDGLLSTTVQIAVGASGAVVGVDALGIPFYSSTGADGWPVAVDPLGIPYIDTSTAVVTTDPFGKNGGTPGFPLPADFLKLIKCTVVYSDNRIGAVDVVNESARLDNPRPGRPTAFVSGNRLVPVRPLATGNSGDPWSQNIASIQLSYVELPVSESMDDPVILPATLTECLVATAANTFATYVPGMSAMDRQRFASDVVAAEAAVGAYSSDMLGSAVTTSVQYRR
jgi:hypothetical protein